MCQLIRNKFILQLLQPSLISSGIVKRVPAFDLIGLRVLLEGRH
jgi:hypothetical protein